MNIRKITVAFLVFSAVTLFGCNANSNLKNNSSHQSESAIVGSFIHITRSNDSSIEITLKCISESQCNLVTVLESERSGRSRHVDSLNNVTSVTDLKIAQNALRHAISKQSINIKNRNRALTMNQLRSTLKNNPSVKRCWDLHYPTKKYTLACTLTNTIPEETPIFLFITTLARCNGAFCRYLIHPMQHS